MSDFYRGRRILITGHTGFKGMWLSKMLVMSGAEVTGYALPPAEDSVFADLRLTKDMDSVFGDVRAPDELQKVFEAAKPEIVFHLAAQPIVLRSYEEPVLTYETNIMGTVNLLECVRKSPDVRSVVNVTTDKVYKNREWSWGYRENEELNGFDPYSNSKSCSELVTDSYKNCFLQELEIAVSAARAGNVIGGGDFSPNRIIPDCIRAAYKAEKIIIRNPDSVRPYQHVLEPLQAYMMIAEAQYNDLSLADCYNVGPDECDAVTTGELADVFCTCWGDGLGWQARQEASQHEANYLRLDCSKIKQRIGWRPQWRIQEAVQKTVDWAREYRIGGSMDEMMEAQIRDFRMSWKF